MLDEVISNLKNGDVAAIGKATQRNFFGPLQTVIPWASNLYTESLIKQVTEEFGEDFWGFWMLGGMSGGGMGFIFHPDRRVEAQGRLQEIMSETKRKLEGAVPFAMEPVVYDFAINENGTFSELRKGSEALMPSGYYSLTVPEILKISSKELSSHTRSELDRFSAACKTNPKFAGMVSNLFDRMLPSSGADEAGQKNLAELLEKNGFDQVQHERIRADLRSGRIGLAQNRLPVRSKIEDVYEGDVFDATGAINKKYRDLGLNALSEGAVAVVSLAGGAGSRWTKGAGVVKALNPFAKIGGTHRNFIEVHLAKSRRISNLTGMELPHVITTSYLTHEPITNYLNMVNNFGYTGPLHLSLGKYVGLRLIPMTRDLRFAWEEMPQQLLDEQAQKVQDSLHNALINWAKQSGEGMDYTDNLPLQCMHPVGHWFEIPNLLRNGVLKNLLDQHPNLSYLMMHNVDTLGADVDPAMLGLHIAGGASVTA